MILIALLLIVAVVATILISKSKRASHPMPPTGVSKAANPASTDIAPYVDALIQRWTDAELMTRETAEKIRAFERAAIEAHRPSKEGRSNVHAIAEALGYLGGMLGIVGLVVLLADFWEDFSDPVRLALSGGATALLVIAGAFVPEALSPAMARLRTFLWLLATVASGLAAWVFVDVVLDASDIRRQWLAVGIVSATVSGALWAGRNRPVQQFTGLAGAVVAIGTAIGEFASIGFSGLGVWTAGVLLLVPSIRRTGIRAGVYQFAGSLGVVVGGYLTVADWRGPGLLFVLATGLALIAPASVRAIELPGPTQVVTGVVGLVALVQGIPMSLVHFADEAGLATGLIVWAAGILLVVVTGRSMLRLDLGFHLVSGVMLIGGAAVTAAQFVGFATVFGLATSIAMIAIGARPGRALMSVFGLVGIVVFVPWTISHFFPGEGRAPLLIIVSGLVIVGVAVVLTRLSGRIRGEVRHLS